MAFIDTITPLNNFSGYCDTNYTKYNYVNTISGIIVALVNSSGLTQATADTLYYSKNNTSGFITTGQTGQFSTGNLSNYSTNLNVLNTGQTNYNLIIGLSGASNNSFATITNLQSSGQNLYNLLTNLSGTNNNNFSTISNLQTTGQNIYSLLIGLSGSDATTYSTIVNLQNTGQNLYNTIINLSGQLNSTGTNLQNQINTTVTNLQSSGSNLFNYITSISGVINNSGGLLFNDINGLSGIINNVIINLASTGQQDYISTTNNSTNLSGNLQSTGSNLQGQINTLTTNLQNTGSNLYTQINNHIVTINNLSGNINLTNGLGTSVITSGQNILVGILNTGQTSLTGNYLMTSTGVVYRVLTGVIGSGSWVIEGSADFASVANTSYRIGARITDGTTCYGYAEGFCASAGASISGVIPLDFSMGFAKYTTPTNVYMEVMTSQTGTIVCASGIYITGLFGQNTNFQTTKISWMRIA